MALEKPCRALMFSLTMMLAVTVCHGKAVPDESGGNYEAPHGYSYGHENEDPWFKYYGPQNYLQPVPPLPQKKYFTPMINGKPIIVPPVGDTSSDINKMLHDHYNIKEKVSQHGGKGNAQRYKTVQYNVAPESKYAHPITYDYKNKEVDYYEEPVISNVVSKKHNAVKDINSQNFVAPTENDMQKYYGIKQNYQDIKDAESKNEKLVYEHPQVHENKDLFVPYEIQSMSPDKMKNGVYYDDDEKHGGKNFYVSKVKTAMKIPTEDYDYDLPLIHKTINVKNVEDFSQNGKEKDLEEHDSQIFTKGVKKTNIGGQKGNLQTPTYTTESERDFDLPVVVKVKKVPGSKKPHKTQFVPYEVQSMPPDRIKDEVESVDDKKHGGKNFYVSKVKTAMRIPTEDYDYDLPLIHETINVKNVEDFSQNGKKKDLEEHDSQVFTKGVKKTNIGGQKTNLQTPTYTTESESDFDLPVVVKVKKVPGSKKPHKTRFVPYEVQSMPSDGIKGEVESVDDKKHGGKNYVSKVKTAMKIPTEDYDYDLPLIHETINVKNVDFSQNGKEKELDGYDSQVFTKGVKKNNIGGQKTNLQTPTYTTESETDFDLPVVVKVKKVPGSEKAHKTRTPHVKYTDIAKETKVTTKSKGAKHPIDKDFKDVLKTKDSLPNTYTEKPELKNEWDDNKKANEKVKPTVMKRNNEMSLFPNTQISEGQSTENLPEIEHSNIHNNEVNSPRANADFNIQDSGSGNAKEDTQSFSLDDKARSFLSSFNPSLWSLVFNPNAKDHKSRKCVTRKEEPGHCTYIQNCPVPNIATSLEQLLNNACVVDEMFIGVCCPEFPVESIKVHWEMAHSNSSDKAFEGLGHNTEDCGTRSGEVSKMNWWPWKAPLLSMSNGKIFCGGVVISDEYVLTAAHCTTKIPKNQILVRIGQHDDTSGEDYPVIEIKRHAQYNPRNLHNDIALLKLGRRIVHDEHTGIVCLPEDDDDNDDHDGDKGILLGWQGIFGKNPKRDQLELLEVMSLKECKEKMGANVPDSMLCTETRKEEERTCNADSGAPLIVEDDDKYEVIGILSWNRNDCDPRFPSTFSRVSSYLGWIRKHAV